jgi:hypothetical protein
MPPPGERTGPAKFDLVTVESQANWLRRLYTCAQTVCRIEIQNFIMMGFLVGPDIIMTGYCQAFADWARRKQEAKVSEDLLFDPRTVVIRFGPLSVGPLQSAASTDAALESSSSLGPAYALAEDWLIDIDPGLNCSLLRIQGMPGLDRVWDGGVRRWLRPALNGVFRSGEPLFLLMYPSGSALSLCYAVQEKSQMGGKQIEYLARTQHECMGSPCFNEELKLVAMHIGQVGMGQADAPSIKFGVSMRALLRRPKIMAALFEELPTF